MTALVGPSGAGKTTLSSLVPRLYDTVSGSITIDGHDVKDATLASVSAAVGVVTQDPHLFHDTIAANLRYARPSATDAELEAACRAARIHDLIVSLPDGYDTVVGERGYRLVRWGKTTPGDRPGPPQGSGRGDPGRGHRPPGLGNRASGPAGAGGGPHGAGRRS